MFWKTTSAERFSPVVMDSIDGVNFSCTLSVEGNETIQYYIEAKDVRGMTETIPDKAPQQKVYTIEIQ